MRLQSRRWKAAVVLGLFLAMALSAVVVATPAARADVSTIHWVGLGTVSSSNFFDRSPSALLSDGDGHFYVFYYTASHATGSTNINVTKYDTSGGLLGLPTKQFDTQVNDFANTNLVYSGFPLSATMDTSGNLYVAWTKVPSSLGNEVYVSKSTDGGQTWQAAVPVRAASTNYNDIWPYIATTPSGTVYVAWTQDWPSGSFLNITIAHSTNGGNTFGGVMNISGQGRNGRALDGPIAIDSLGRIQLAYIGIMPSGYYTINTTWSDDGLTWAPVQQITPSNDLAIYPSMVVDAQNRVHLAWYDYRGLLTVGAPQMWYSRSDNRGASWIPATPISQGGSYPAGAWPSMAVHGNTVMAAWLGSSGGNEVLSYAVSLDGGNAWLAERIYNPGYTLASNAPAIGVDENDTFYAGVTQAGTVTTSAQLLAWMGPPSAPTNLAVVTSGTNGLATSWTAPPEKNVVGYHVYMSTDGVTYTLVADVAGTTYTATGLANGTYFFKVAAVNSLGTESVLTSPVAGTIGPTIGQLNAEIQSLQTQIAALQASLATAQGSLNALQTQLNSLQTQLTNLQNSQAASNSATAAKLAQLQQELNQTRADLAAAQAAQATQTMSYVNLGLGVVIILLLVVIVLQMRKPKGPQMMMAQPGQAPPSKPDDEL